MFNKFFMDICAILAALIGLIMGEDKPDAMGNEKKAAVVTKMEQILDEPGGLDWPALLPKGATRTWLIGFLVDQLVKVAKNTGFFGK